MADSSAAELARRVGRKLQVCGHAAYLVGGCVRDLLLEREPKDYDLATDARPERVLALFPGSQLVGAHFGVVLVREGEAEVEVATFRSDHSYLDGRHPSEVRFETDPRQDVLRRDFTINALLMDPRGDQVLDFVGGREDLARGVIRAIGEAEARFGEDHLRMLRAIRFAARFSFEIEAGTFAAIQRLAERIRAISAERIRDELVLILTEGAAARGLDLLDGSGLLEVLLPEVAAMKGVAQPPEFHPEGDVWTHVRLMLGEMRAPTPTLALGVLLHDVGKPRTFAVRERIRFDGHAELSAQMAIGILTRLKFSNDDIRHVTALAAHHLRFKDITRMRTSTLKRFLRMDRFEEHLELHRLDCISSHRLLGHYYFAKSKLGEFSTEQLKPRPLLSGHDLIAAGYRPGPSFAKMLKAVEDAQLEGEIHTREEGLELVRARFEAPEGGPTPGGR